MINLGFDLKRKAMSFALENIYKSSWNKFPHRYKYIGLTINVSDVIEYTYRETYGLLGFFADIGGFYQCLRLIGFLVVRSMINYNFLSLIANRMYIWENPDKKAE